MRSGCRRFMLLCAIAVGGCGDSTSPGEQPATDLAKNIPLYSGSIGLVVDTRDIFKLGYRPATAEISFTGQPAFNDTVSIDSLTDVAILVIQNDSLSDAQKKAFANGIATTIIIRDTSHTELGRLEDVVQVDNSNVPLSITSPLPAVASPIVLGGPGAAYLLQREGTSDLVTRTSLVIRLPPPSNQVLDTITYDEEGYPALPDANRQLFTFTRRPDSTYRVGQWAAPDLVWCEAGILYSINPPHLQLVLELGQCPVANEARVVLEPDPDGWMRLKIVGGFFGGGDTASYVAWGPGGLTISRPDSSAPNSHDQASRFRLISNDIDWTISDQGTSFDQPIIPPAHLQFAYLGTLTNCSPASLTETVGDDITKSTNTTFTTLESVELFTGNVQTVGVKASASVDIPITGTSLLGPEVTVTAEASWQGAWSTNKTTTTENTQSTATTSTLAVSRARQLQVPPFTGVVVADYVKSIDNVVQPFTQRSRVRGVYHSNGARLSGQEIVTQMHFNLFQGVITRIGADFLEYTIRGDVQTNQFLQAETTVQEIPNACPQS